MSEIETASKYEGDYKGNKIFYDQDATNDVRNRIITYINALSDEMVAVAEKDKYFDGLKKPYDKLIPDPRFANIMEGVEAELERIGKATDAEIDEIVNAIKDYSDGGDILLKSSEVLGALLASKGGPGGSPSGGPAGGPGFVPEDKLDTDSDSDEDKTDLKPTDSNIPNNNMDIPVLPSGGDDELQNHANTGFTVLGGVGLGVAGSELSDAGDINLSDESTPLDDLGTSFFGSNDGGFIIPSFGGTVAKTDGVKSSSITGVVGAVMAAGAAMGGKVYYDKKKESDDENVDEDVLEKSTVLESDDNIEVKNAELEEIETSVDGIDFGLNGVKLKESLLNLGKEDK